MANNSYLIIFLSVIILYGNVSSSPTDGCQSTTIQKHGFYNVPFWRMDSPNFKHVKIQKNPAGLSLFEMYFTVKSYDNFDILISHNADNIDVRPEYFYSILIKPCSVTLHQKRALISTTERLHLLSWDHFTEFYIKISGDWLLLGIRGQEPFLAFTDSTIKTMQYFSFNASKTDVNKPPQIYFDCP